MAEQGYESVFPAELTAKEASPALSLPGWPWEAPELQQGCGSDMAIALH